MSIGVAGMRWLTIIPQIIALIIFGTGIYLTILLIKALRLYIKNNS